MIAKYLPFADNDMEIGDFDGVEVGDVSKMVIGGKKRKFPYADG